MASSIFRKSSIERVNSPEQLNEYIRVTNPGVWLILAAVIVLLLGIVAWSVFGTIETKIDAGAVVSDGEAVCYITPSQIDSVAAGMSVEIAGSTGTVASVPTAPSQYDGSDTASALYFSGLTTDDFAYRVTLNVTDVGDGVYPCKITVDSVSAISFIVD